MELPKPIETFESHSGQVTQVKQAQRKVIIHTNSSSPESRKFWLSNLEITSRDNQYFFHEKIIVKHNDTCEIIGHAESCVPSSEHRNLIREDRKQDLLNLYHAETIPKTFVITKKPSS